MVTLTVLEDVTRVEDLTIQCSWCQRIEHQGDPTLPTSHSMCASCAKRWDADITARFAAKLATAVVVGALSIGCSGANPAEPTATPYQAPLVTTADPLPPRPAMPGLVVTGPSGCVEANTLPAVVVWNISNVPDGAVFTKGYHFDDTVNCDSTEQRQRTQNDHLRVIPTGPQSVRVEFDRDTEVCTGRQQPDVSLDGAVVVGMVIKRSDGKTCKAPAPEPVPTPGPVPSPPVPVPPAPPSGPSPAPSPRGPTACAAPNHEAFTTPVFISSSPSEPLVARATFNGEATWLFVLHMSQNADGSGATWPKHSRTTVLPCGEQRTISVTYAWMQHPGKAAWTTLHRNGVLVWTSPRVTK